MRLSGLNKSVTAQSGQETPTPEGGFSVIQADEPGEPEWDQSINISRSSATSDPQMVVDNRGITHILWRNALDGFLYSRGQEQDWSNPVSLELPFATRVYSPDLSENEETPLFTPALVAD